MKPTIQPMRAREAKDLLVAQTAEQAALEGVPLSDLEKRMMYFTETDECPEDPIALNDAFEAEYDTDEYEAKISKLMHHAHSRIQKENPEAARQWNEAMRGLSKGDHYILILCGGGFNAVQVSPTEHPPHDSLKLLLAGLFLVAIVMSVMFLGAHYGIGWKSGPKTTSSMPKWLQQVLLTLLILGVGRSLVKFLGTSSGTGGKN
jgi:hypothetical protein